MAQSCLDLSLWPPHGEGRDSRYLRPVCGLLFWLPQDTPMGVCVWGVADPPGQRKCSYLLPSGPNPGPHSSAAGPFRPPGSAVVLTDVSGEHEGV